MTFSGVDYCLKYFSVCSRKLISAGNSSLYVLKKLISPRNSFWVNLLLRHMCVFMFQKVESKHKVFQASSYSALEQTRKLAQIIFSGMARWVQVTAINWRLFYGKTYCLPLKAMFVANCHPAQFNGVCLSAQWTFFLQKLKLFQICFLK